MELAPEGSRGLHPRKPWTRGSVFGRFYSSLYRYRNGERGAGIRSKCKFGFITNSKKKIERFRLS